MLNTFLRRNLRRVGALALLFLAGLLPLTLATAKATTVGEQRTAVILVNFQDLATEPFTKAAAHSMVFGAVSDFYWEASYQKTFFSGETFGWFTVPVSRASCDVELIVREANKAATAAGADLSTYDRMVYLSPDNACTATGYNSGTAKPTRTSIFSNYLSANDVAHELGHNFGLSHSQSLDCGSVELATNCTVRSYGDPADTMGSGTLNHFNAFQKDSLGWIGETDASVITTIIASGRYQILPLAASGGGSKALKVARGIDNLTGEINYYYVEFRQRTGHDSTLLGNLGDGLLVHVGGPNQYSRLLDMTPNSDPVYDHNDVYDSALTIGRTYTDAEAGIAFTLLAVDANGATVDVSIAGSDKSTCMHAAPVMNISDPGIAVPAGSTLSYTVKLTNNDSGACGATAFSLARSIPSGWVGQLSTTTLSLSPGASGSATLNVTSPTLAEAGSYGVGVGASSDVGAVHTASDSATYAVATSSQNGVLTESVGTDKLSYVRGETVYMSALVKRDGMAVSGANVVFSIKLPSGGTASSSTTTDGDGYARSKYKIGKAQRVIGSYEVRADATSNGSDATASSTFSVK